MPDVIIVAGGRRGVGTSFVASLVALAARRLERRTLVIDAVDSDASQHALFGLAPSASVWELASHRADPQAVAVPVDEWITLLPGMTAGAAAPPKRLEQRSAVLQSAVAAFPTTELVVIDAGATLASVRAAIDGLEGDVLLVAAPDRATLAATHGMAKALWMRRPSRNVAVITNRDPRGWATYDMLRVAATRFLGNTLDVVGPLPDDPAIHAALAAGFTMIDAAEESAATVAVADWLASAAVPASPTVPTRGWS